MLKEQVIVELPIIDLEKLAEENPFGLINKDLSPKDRMGIYGSLIGEYIEDVILREYLREGIPLDYVSSVGFDQTVGIYSHGLFTVIINTKDGKKKINIESHRADQKAKRVAMGLVVLQTALQNFQEGKYLRVVGQDSSELGELFLRFFSKKTIHQETQLDVYHQKDKTGDYFAVFSDDKGKKRLFKMPGFSGEFESKLYGKGCEELKDTERVVLLSQLSYFGKMKAEVYRELDRRFGRDEWDLKWFIDGKVKEQADAIELYEESYYLFLRDNPEILNWLVKTASEVYDIAPCNVHSELNYLIQECDATHLQDITLRRVLRRLGRKFEGDHLVQIRGHESEGYILNPGQVPFHRPEIIIPCERKSWWEKGSVEDFYQSNKALVIPAKNLIVTPAIVCPDGSLMFEYDKKVYYTQWQGNPRILQRVKGRTARRLAHEDRRYKLLKDQEIKPYDCFLETANRSNLLVRKNS